MSDLWRGTLATRARIASGLILFTYALVHFLNIGIGLFSPDLMDRMQEARQIVTRSLPGTVILYGAILIHAGLALTKLARRRTLRMPLWEASQLVLGLLIPVFLITHVTYTRGAHELVGVDDQYAYVIGLIFGTKSGTQQLLLLVIVWSHACIGLHFWLRGQPLWQRGLPLLSGLAALVPAFAFAGYLTEGRRVAAIYADADAKAALRATFNYPDGHGFALLAQTDSRVQAVLWAALALTAFTYLAGKLLKRRRNVRIRYIEGPQITAAKGMTLLEMSRANGVPHTALCGGRGRCTTCRVVVEQGLDLLHPPSPTEQRSLAAVSAPANTRLACQIRPTDPATVFRVFRADGRQNRKHASQGEERRMAILFLDIRGFTARTSGQLPYDVVFLLNRFFDAIVPAITRSGGSVDKYLGDGLLAIFETPDEATSARAALTAVADIGTALDKFNHALETEGAQGLRIGMGLHLGDLVLGEIGAAGRAPRTIIGETVNAASRLEAATKDLQVELLVSQTVLHSAGVDMAALDMTTISLRGVPDPLPVLAVPRASTLPALLITTATA